MWQDNTVSQQKIQLPFKIRLPNLKLFLVLLVFLTGCALSNNLKQARQYCQQSQAYYQRAVAKYKDLIRVGKDLDRLYLELGRLYYAQGEFEAAQEAFKQSNASEAKKFLAISYYKLGRFSDALEIFNRYPSTDSEYLYYQGLASERLNLFDQALEIYKKIEDKEFGPKANIRIQAIEKEAGLGHIKDISPQVYKILQSAPAQELYPQAGALVLSCDERIEISDQNTQLTQIHYVIKILNERGKEDFSETHIDYDSTYERIELEYARTIKPDGQVVEVGSRHIRDVSKYLNFPLYSNVRVFIISFPEITEGASIEYKLKIYRNQLINKKDFMVSYPLQAAEPIIRADFTLDLPKEKTLYMKVLNEQYNNFGAQLKPQIKEVAGRIIYQWYFKDIPQIIPESNMPPNVRINPTLLISTFKDWQEIYDWWWKLTKDKIKIDEVIKDKVKELTQQLKSEEEKLRAIYNFCAQEIRYVAVEYGQAGYEPHLASDIFKNKYGDCKDQAVLLVTMLKEAGFQSWPVLIATKDYYNLNEDFPAVFFNHCIAALKIKDKIIFLDTTCGVCSFGELPIADQDRKVLVFKEDGFEIQDTPLYSARYNLNKQQLSIKLNKDESVWVQKSIFTSGVYDQAQRFWLLYTPPELIEQTLKEKIQETSIGARLENYEIKNLDDLNKTIILSYVFSGPEYLTLAGSLRIMPQLAGLDTALVAKDKRKYALDLDFLDYKENLFEIEIPDNFVIKYIPTDLNEDSPWLKFSAEYKHKDNKIIFAQKTELKKNIINESEYPEFKEFFVGLAKKVKQRIVLERID